MTSPMKRILVLISGNGSNLQTLLDHCASGKIAGDVVGVISNRADAYGLVRAREAGVATAILAQQQFASRAEYDAALLALMADYQPDRSSPWGSRVWSLMVHLQSAIETRPSHRALSY